MKKATASVFGSLLILGAVATPSQAVRDVDQDGLVNVSVGNVEILNDVNIAVAANVAAQLCGIKVGPVILLATQVDATDVSSVVCDRQGQRNDVTITD
ncbi:hypothetical protein [Arthrobacter rhizosphaerae]|uniref:hypothetical protein n=1 Tax=Arthrobacter rhizosphaerae TaxID=2855490 RepID=UPI001FF15700|nr:hypothetical protein [Arthrobacter rhizosphaerae]